MHAGSDDASEIELLYRQHGPGLLLFALSITGERARAQDAVQQVFLKIMDRKVLRRVADPKAYLFAWVRNNLLNERNVRQRDVALEDGFVWFEPLNRDYAAEANLRRALEILPDDQRQVTILHVWGELTFSQVAELLDISANTAASRYRYAPAKLREAMSVKEVMRDHG